MNTKKLFALFLIVASPVAIFASSASDRKIEMDAKASYNYRTVLEDHVNVKAHDGVVTLTGTVADKEDKMLAEDTVQNLPGVVSVRNEIKVDSKYAEHSDGWIALKIRSRLLVKANVSAATTKVAVNDGVVLLTGTAKNQAQKELTEAYAKDIEGVKKVTNEIMIRDELAANDRVNGDRMTSDRTNRDRMSMNNDRMNGETAGEKIDDASITTQVKYALLSHKSTSALKTKVTTTDGVVHLSGYANSDAEKSLATKLAQDVRGTRSVTNDMTVNSGG